MKKIFMFVLLFFIKVDFCSGVRSLKDLSASAIAKRSFDYIISAHSMLSLEASKSRIEQHIGTVFERLPEDVWLNFSLKTIFWGVRGNKIQKMIPRYAVVKIVEDLKARSEGRVSHICFDYLLRAARTRAWIETFFIQLSSNENDRRECFSFLKSYDIDLQAAYDLYFDMNPGRRVRVRRMKPGERIRVPMMGLVGEKKRKRDSRG